MRARQYSVVITLLLVAGCAKDRQIPEQETYAQPNWYAECEQKGSEGLLWWGSDYVYACGMGVSRFEHVAESHARSFAITSYDERIHGKAESSTNINITEDQKKSETNVTYMVPLTAIREQIEAKRSIYLYEGKYHVFIRLKMSVEDYENLKRGAIDERVNNASAVSDLDRMFNG